MGGWGCGLGPGVMRRPAGRGRRDRNVSLDCPNRKSGVPEQTGSQVSTIGPGPQLMPVRAFEPIPLSFSLVYNWGWTELKSRVPGSHRFGATAMARKEPKRRMLDEDPVEGLSCRLPYPHLRTQGDHVGEAA